MRPICNDPPEARALAAKTLRAIRQQCRQSWFRIGGPARRVDFYTDARDTLWNGTPWCKTMDEMRLHALAGNILHLQAERIALWTQVRADRAAGLC